MAWDHCVGPEKDFNVLERLCLHGYVLNVKHFRNDIARPSANRNGSYARVSDDLQLNNIAININGCNIMQIRHVGTFCQFLDLGI